ncbi:hypothetical protein F2Q68_00022289 [Brassica cretica]|uniref:Uncharacterized protein n=1 Tax=Brassica cretica TaxID=69181 RepID=A0A8S9FZY9_BRACR|nr:hypothetical protein F2Q68_00022289 [Brassica cretica]
MRWSLVRREERRRIWLRDEGGDGFQICNHSFRYVQARITTTNQLRTEDIVVRKFGMCFILLITSIGDVLHSKLLKGKRL